MTELWEGPKRRHRRIALEVDVLVLTNGAVLPGLTQDISESGAAAILPIEPHVGAEVELQIKLPSGTQALRASTPPCDTVMSIVMALSSCSRWSGFFRKDAGTGDLYLEQGNKELHK